MLEAAFASLHRYESAKICTTTYQEEAQRTLSFIRTSLDGISLFSKHHEKEYKKAFIVTSA